MKNEKPSVEEIWKKLNAEGIKTQEDLNKALKENALNIGMFTMPFKKDDKKEAQKIWLSKKTTSEN